MPFYKYICFLLSVACLAISNETGFAQEKLRIGSWNIENLGVRSPSPGESADHPQKPADLAKNIIDAEVQVLALQEIHDIGPGERRNEVLDKTFEKINEDNDSDWTYMLLPKKDEGENYQLLGVA